ncbi:hypothetical protein O181_023059 [Austropuccinia psidii MF-1]|uniref:Uncharacterized protein n=1 Tax=Austropuccinia psidii MF-1 TaxID=1389203 RepID=A0A9Q3CDR2_9BASI|nr:hypothetical protein [Austropuccinia psidii MF-1]
MSLPLQLIKSFHCRSLFEQTSLKIFVLCVIVILSINVQIRYARPMESAPAKGVRQAIDEKNGVRLTEQSVSFHQTSDSLRAQAVQDEPPNKKPDEFSPFRSNPATSFQTMEYDGGPFQ